MNQKQKKEKKELADFIFNELEVGNDGSGIPAYEDGEKEEAVMTMYDITDDNPALDIPIS